MNKADPIDKQNRTDTGNKPYSSGQLIFFKQGYERVSKFSGKRRTFQPMVQDDWPVSCEREVLPLLLLLRQERNDFKCIKPVNASNQQSETCL